MNDKQYELIVMYSKVKMTKLGVHAWAHIQRVVHLCELITKKEGLNVDLDVVRIAALLHDIAKDKETRSTDHGDKGALMAEELLQSLGFSDKKTKLITDAIRAHTNRDEPASTEAKILRDADFIDKLGAVGVATVFIKASLTSRTIEEVAESYESDADVESAVGKHISWLKKPYLHTKTAQEMAEKRNKIVTAFFDALKKELNE